jgi:hypothetical protein
MKRIAVLLTVLGLALGAARAHAGWSELAYSGYQPWWDTFARRNKCMTCEEERLQKFWHDYYDGLRNHYAALDRIDWVAYYKDHGYQVNAGCPGCAGCGRVKYAPVFINPAVQGPPGAARPTPPVDRGPPGRPEK